MSTGQFDISAHRYQDSRQVTSFPKTVIFWGAGATASLNIRTTAAQARSIHALGGAKRDSSDPLRVRVEKALAPNTDVRWVKAFTDLLTILGDHQESHGNEREKVLPSTAVTQAQIDTMRCHWREGADENELRQRIHLLQSLYDWLALKAAIGVCPGWNSDSTFLLQDLFNILDMHSQSGHGFRVYRNEFLTPQRIIGAVNVLKLLLYALFYVDWLSTAHNEEKKQELQHHLSFTKMLSRFMQRDGIKMASENKFDSREFYMGNFAIVSLNYDPLGLWFQYIANRSMNRSPTVPYVGAPARRIQIFNDLGQFVAAERTEADGNTQFPWFPMNETAVQRLNEKSDRTGEVIRISKFLFPHGCVCWRECPDCGKLSSYMGSEWRADSSTLIPPPPLRAFTDGVDFQRRGDRETKEWDKGAVDARECVYCGTMTYAHHTQTIMPTNFKQAPPPVLEEIQRDMRVVVQNADHIVLMGYSLPPDDVLYRAFFAARQQRGSDIQVKCTVVGLDSDEQDNQCWLGPLEWSARMERRQKSDPPRSTLEAARDLFGKENVRFYGGGVPNVFLEGGQVTEAAISRLLNWG